MSTNNNKHAHVKYTVYAIPMYLHLPLLSPCLEQLSMIFLQ